MLGTSKPDHPVLRTAVANPIHTTYSKRFLRFVEGSNQQVARTPQEMDRYTRRGSSPRTACCPEKNNVAVCNQPTTTPRRTYRTCRMLAWTAYRLNDANKKKVAAYDQPALAYAPSNLQHLHNARTDSVPSKSWPKKKLLRCTANQRPYPGGPIIQAYYVLNARMGRHKIASISCPKQKLLRLRANKRPRPDKTHSIHTRTYRMRPLPSTVNAPKKKCRSFGANQRPRPGGPTSMTLYVQDAHLGGIPSEMCVQDAHLGGMPSKMSVQDAHLGGIPSKTCVQDAHLGGRHTV